MDIQKATEFLSHCCAKLKIQSGARVIAIKGDRWFIAYDQSPDFPHFANAMIRLEGIVRSVTANHEIELMLEGLADKNKRVKKAGRTPLKLVSARNVDSLG